MRIGFYVSLTPTHPHDPGGPGAGLWLYQEDESWHGGHQHAGAAHLDCEAAHVQRSPQAALSAHRRSRQQHRQGYWAGPQPCTLYQASITVNTSSCMTQINTLCCWKCYQYCITSGFLVKAVLGSKNLDVWSKMCFTPSHIFVLSHIFSHYSYKLQPSFGILHKTQGSGQLYN